MSHDMDGKASSLRREAVDDGDAERGPGELAMLQEVPSEVPGMPAATDTPPEGGYGWVCVACSFWVNSCTWGVNSSYGVFLAHYLKNDTFPGATPLEYAFVGGLSVAMSMIIGPLATMLLRITSTRVVMSLGLFFLVGSLVAASFASQIWHLFLTQGVAFGLGMGFLFIGSTGVISQWFSKKRSVANGITAAGSGIGGITWSLSTRAIIARYGVPWAFRTIAISTLVVHTLCIIAIKDRNKHINPHQRAFDMKMLKCYEFWLLLAWGFFSMLGYVCILFSLPDYAASRGFSASQGSILGALLNLGMCFGRPVVGLVSDSLGRFNVAAAATFISGFTVFVIWIPAHTFGVAAFFAVVNGAVCGTYWTTVAPLTVEVVGLRELPSALSLVWLSIAIPTSVSEVIGLELRTPGAPNEYLHPQVFSGAMFMGATACVWWLRAWKLGERERRRMVKEGDGRSERVRKDVWWKWATV